MPVIVRHAQNQIHTMITFGYKSKFSSLLRALAAVAIGLVMIFSNNATITVVKIISAFLFAAGVVTFAYGYYYRKNGGMSLMLVNSAVDVALGLLLFFFAPKVCTAIIVIIGLVLILFGGLQLIVISGTMSLIGGGVFSLVLSCLAILGGMALLFNPFGEMVMRIFAGVFLIVYGASEVFSMFRVSKAQKEYEIRFEKKEEPAGPVDVTSSLDDAKEVEFREIDEQ